MIADEPTGDLDSETVEEIIDLLLEVNKENASVIMVTHDEEYLFSKIFLTSTKEGSRSNSVKFKTSNKDDS